MTGGFGADYTFEATGNVAVMRQAVEAARMGWGLCTVAGVAGKGETLDIVPRFLITGRRVARLLVRRRQGPRPGAAARRALPRRRHRRRPVHLPPHHARRGQPRLRADGGPGRHPQRDLVLMIDHVKLFVADADGEPRLLRGGPRAARLPGAAGLRDRGRHGQGPPGLLDRAGRRTRRRRAATSPSAPTRSRRSSASTRRRWPPAAPTTASPARGPTTTRTTTARSPSTPTATTSRPSTTERCSPSR